MEQIRAYFNKFLPLTDIEWGDFAACFKKETFSKKEFLLREGETCDFIAFIAEGLYRFYYVQEGEEKVTAFFFSGDFVTNYRSFLTGKPSEHYIETLKPSTVYKLHKKDLLMLYDKHKSIERLGRFIAENLYLTVTARLDSFLHGNPENRYQELLNRNSKLLQEVPQYMLASYLGIKPETLSRIRARK
jgi:CRP/FNR family transcriptional regulator, anaerobic regulatory protein